MVEFRRLIQKRVNLQSPSSFDPVKTVFAVCSRDDTERGGRTVQWQACCCYYKVQEALVWCESVRRGSLRQTRHGRSNRRRRDGRLEWRAC